MRHVARGLSLLGKHSAAVDVYNEAIALEPADWELHHSRAVCRRHLQDLDGAAAGFKQALDLQPNEASFEQLGHVLLAQDDASGALAVLQDALDHTPNSADILCQVGLLHLRKGDNDCAQLTLQEAATANPRHPQAVLALGSVLQDGANHDGALLQYQAAAHIHPESPQVWSNIGMAFFGKGRGMTALACLERARLQGPFEWIPSFNLGLVHLHMGHDVAAYTSFSAAINLNAGFAQSYMLLGIALGRLSDLDNACHAFQRAMDLDAGNALIVLNFAIALHHGGRQDEAAARLQEFHSMQTQEPGAEDALHGEMQDQAALLAAALSD